MFRTRLARHAAAFWGFVVYMPVGVNYAAFLFLMIAMSVGGNWRERAQRVRSNPLFWPIVAYLAWTLIVLAIRPHYGKETGTEFFHAVRIAVTVLLALALSREECIWALRAFLLVSVISLGLIVLHHLGVLPDAQIWRAVVSIQGNKSINDALLFATIGAAAAVLGMAHLGDARRWHWAGPAFAVAALMVVVVSLALPSRTSLLAMLACIFAACFHQYRSHRLGLAASLAVAVLIAGVGVWQLPQSIKARFAAGIHEVEQASAGLESEDSWVTRYYMYKLTGEMMLDAPMPAHSQTCRGGKRIRNHRPGRISTNLTGRSSAPQPRPVRNSSSSQVRLKNRKAATSGQASRAFRPIQCRQASSAASNSRAPPAP